MDKFDFADYSSDYENYTYENATTEHTVFTTYKSCLDEFPCILSIVAIFFIFVLGVCGNGIVIWIAGFKIKKKTVNTTWYLSLAVSDFIFCICLPLNAAYTATSDWIFGKFMCKFISFIMFLNMFSSIFLLVIISVDRCVAVMFPVWSQNQRTVKKATLIVTLAWIISVFLSFPSAVFRDTKVADGKTVCFNNYDMLSTHKVVVLSRLIVGFVLPFIIIISCYSIIICRLKRSQMAKSSKPFKVMSALIATFFVCWLPYHVFVLLEFDYTRYNLVRAGQMIGSTLAFANSFFNPILYVFMGNDFKRRFKNIILSKIENAISEEGRTTSRYLSRSSSVDAKCSTYM